MAYAAAPFATSAAATASGWDADRGVVVRDPSAATPAPATPPRAAYAHATPAPATSAHASSVGPALLSWLPAGSLAYDPQLDAFDAERAAAARRRERRHPSHGPPRLPYEHAPYATEHAAAATDVVYVDPSADTPATDRCPPQSDFGFGHRAALASEAQMMADSVARSTGHNPLVWAPNQSPDQAYRAAQAAALQADRDARATARGMRHFADTASRAPPGSPPYASAPFATASHDVERDWHSGWTPAPAPAPPRDERQAEADALALAHRLAAEQEAAKARRAASDAQPPAPAAHPPARAPPPAAAPPATDAPPRATGAPPAPGRQLGSLDRYLLEVERTGPSLYASQFREFTAEEREAHAGQSCRQQRPRRHVVDEPIDYRSTYQVMAAHVPDPVSTTDYAKIYDAAHGIDSARAAETHKERGSRRQWYERPGMAGRATARRAPDPPPSETYVTESMAGYSADALSKPKPLSRTPFRNRFKSAASRGPLMI